MVHCHHLCYTDLITEANLMIGNGGIHVVNHVINTKNELVLINVIHYWHPILGYYTSRQCEVITAAEIVVVITVINCRNSTMILK